MTMQYFYLESVRDPECHACGNTYQDNQPGSATVGDSEGEFNYCGECWPLVNGDIASLTVH